MEAVVGRVEAVGDGVESVVGSSVVVAVVAEWVDFDVAVCGLLSVVFCIGLSWLLSSSSVSSTSVGPLLVVVS